MLITLDELTPAARDMLRKAVADLSDIVRGTVSTADGLKLQPYGSGEIAVESVHCARMWGQLRLSREDETTLLTASGVETGGEPESWQAIAEPSDDPDDLAFIEVLRVGLFTLCVLEGGVTVGYIVTPAGEQVVRDGGGAGW